MKALPVNCLVTGLFIVVVLSTFTVGCSRKRGSALEELTVLPAPEESYAVQSGDALFVKVWGEPQLSGEVAHSEGQVLPVPYVFADFPQWDSQQPHLSSGRPIERVEDPYC